MIEAINWSAIPTAWMGTSAWVHCHLICFLTAPYIGLKLRVHFLLACTSIAKADVEGAKIARLCDNTKNPCLQNWPCKPFGRISEVHTSVAGMTRKDCRIVACHAFWILGRWYAMRLAIWHFCHAGELTMWLHATFDRGIPWCLLAYYKSCGGVLFCLTWQSSGCRSSANHAWKLMSPAKLNSSLTRVAKTGKSLTPIMLTSFQHNIDHTIELVLATESSCGLTRMVACCLFWASRMTTMFVTNVNHAVLNMCFAVQASGLAYRYKSKGQAGQSDRMKWTKQ